jgi:hypothetical protein
MVSWQLCGNYVYFAPFWYFAQEKSGNPSSGLSSPTLSAAMTAKEGKKNKEQSSSATVQLSFQRRQA